MDKMYSNPFWVRISDLFITFLKPLHSKGFNYYSAAMSLKLECDHWREFLALVPWELFFGFLDWPCCSFWSSSHSTTIKASLASFVSCFKSGSAFIPPIYRIFRFCQGYPSWAITASLPIYSHFWVNTRLHLEVLVQSKPKVWFVF